MLFEGTKFVAICYRRNRKLVQDPNTESRQALGNEVPEEGQRGPSLSLLIRNHCLGILIRWGPGWMEGPAL